jgi:hypothetical protein
MSRGTKSKAKAVSGNQTTRKKIESAESDKSTEIKLDDAEEAVLG